MVVDGKVDAVIAPFLYSKERNEVLDYINLVDTEYGRIYIQNPKEEFDWEVYTKPLRAESWAGILLFCLIAPIILRVAMCDSMLKY